MRNDERLRTIYEVMAPYIVRSERNWRDYLAFASRFHKQSFDNILLVYAQDEDVTILATKKQWAGVGRNLISRPKGIAVCVYSNARLTLDYLFDISQTVGKEIHPTNWQLSDEMQKALGERLTFSHGFQAQPLPDLLYALAREAVNDNYEHYLQGLRQETKNHLFEEIPAGGFEAQYIQLLSDSVSYFIGKKCHLPDEAIRMGDGMATVSHFNTVPLVAHLGMAVTSISKAVLLEMERNIRIINRERKEKHEQTEHQSALQRTGRDASPRPANFQQQRGGQAPGPVRADGAGISQGQPAGAIYDFENGWQSDGGHAPGTERGHGEDRGPDPADASTGADAADRGYSGANTPPEQSEADGGGNGTPDHRADPPLTEEQPHTEAPQGAEHEGEPPAQDGSLSASPKVEHHFSDEEVRRHYEHILTSTDLYLPELHQAVRAVLADGVTDYNWTEKGREVCGLFSAYGDREFQGEVLYRTKLRGEDGISFYFDDGYTYFPWPSLANLLDALIEAGAYENSGIGVYQEADPADPAQEKKIAGFGQFFATWLNNIASQDYEPVRATMLVNDEEVDVELRPAPEAAPAAADEEPEQLSLLASPSERSPEDLLIERAMLRGPLATQKKDRIYEFARTHPTGSAFASFLKEMYGYEGFPDEAAGLDYVYSGTDSIELHWTDEHGKKRETKLSWPQAAGIVQRLVDEGRYLEAPAVSEPEQKDETQPFSAEYRLLDRLCADCEYFLGEGQRAEKHLWAGSVEAQIAKMRELYAQLPEKPDWLSPETIDAYARRMAAPEQPEETRILDEALGAHSGQIDMLMQAVRGELTVGTLRYSIFEERPHISMIEVLEDYRRQGIATQMLRYLQGQYPDEEIEWGYLTEDGSALYRAVVDEQPNPEYQKVKTDLEDITRLYDGYVQRMEGGGILSPAEAADMDDLEDIQYRLEKELDELRPVRAFVRMEGVPPTQPEERTVTEPPANPRPEPFIPRNFRFSTDYDLYPGGAKTKYKNNILAIKTLKQIEAEQRTATPEEQITLARYVGWGGLANAFSDKAAGWESEYQELKALLTEEEYKAAMRSTITAYYTEPELIRYMYRALERFGFEGGPDRRILDPGMGTGNFYSVLPEQYQGSKLYGVELDSITGRIAKQLYPEADISVMGYEAVKFEDNSFDVILGNIPFNSVKIYDRRYNELNPYIHDYFFIKSLDLAKPGGIIAFITSKGILDRKDESLREYIARRAEFIGAIRLPNTAFKALAGTEVTADIVFLKKRAAPMQLDRANTPSWIQTDMERGKWIPYNRYFMDHPEMLMGKMESSRNMYGNEDGTACIAPESFDLYEHLSDALESLSAHFSAEPDVEPIEEAEEEQPTDYEDAPEGTRNFTFVVKDGEIYYCEKNRLIPQPYTGMKAARIKGLCEIRTALLEVISIQSHEYDPLDLRKAQDKLNQVYDRFTAKYGAINSKGNILAFSDDDQFPLLRSIEDERKDKSGWDKSAIFHKATIRPFREVNHADTAEDALQICLNRKLRVDLSYMSFLTGKTTHELAEELGGRIYLNPQKYYGNPDEGWELAEEYLSGHVRDMPELMAVFREVADIKTSDMLDIPGLPSVHGGKAEIITTETTPAQKAIMAEFILRAEAIRAGRVKPEEDNMLKLTSEARMMAIDPRLVDPNAGNDPESKLNVCINEVYSLWVDTKEQKSVQLIFCDVGTPKPGRFNVYDEIKRVLVEKGVPESEIAFAHDAATEAQRQALFELTRKGDIRILVGSTGKLGTGVNVQDKVIAINHLDCPWKPSDITQRNGRGVRQGNENPEVIIKQFVTKGTFDAYLWQIQEQKLRYITQIMTGRSIARSCEDVDETVLSAAQFKAAATDNPMLAQKMELENRVTELKILRGAWSNEQLSLERKVNTTYPSHIQQYQRQIEQIRQDITLLEQSKAGDFSMSIWRTPGLKRRSRF